MPRHLGVLLALALSVSLAPSASQAEEEKPKVVEDGRTVSLEYTLKLDDGSTAQSNVGSEPLVYQQGGSQILPGLERAVAGLEVQDTKKVTLSAEDGYGAVDPEAFQEIELEMVPEEARTEGAQLVAEDGSGNKRMIRIHEVREDRAVIDLNHPLAGQTLHFEVKILGIE